MSVNDLSDKVVLIENYVEKYLVKITIYQDTAK